MSNSLEIEQLTNKTNSKLFNFINDTDKLIFLSSANSKLNLNKNKVAFIYSAPKVGSTSIVSSLRIFAINKIDIIHIHDEIMLKVLSNIDNITINELIDYNKYLGKDVYVINIYRSPIERKISTFFENIGTYHFNNVDEKLNAYNINKVINRFNNIFPHICYGDHFIDNYNITIPNAFDYNKKFLLVVEKGINYISLRLKDSVLWNQILTKIFGFNISIIKDYESSNKPIRELYNLFKLNYRIPKNLLDEQIKDKYLCYYYSDVEISQYYNNWMLKSNADRETYTIEQYKLYNEITIENSHLDYVQMEHYFDQGCVCNACELKRNNVALKIINNQSITDKDKIIHNNAKVELIERKLTNKLNKIEKINNLIKNAPKKYAGKDFKGEMKSVVKRIN